MKISESMKRLIKLIHPKFQKLILDYPVKFQPRYGHGKPAHAELEQIIERNRSKYEVLLQQATQYAPHFKTWSVDKQDAYAPHWDNQFLPGLDMVMLFTLLGELKPKRYVEVGSGNSTKVAHDAVKHLGLSTHIVSIDPMPRAEIDALAHEVVRKPFESVQFEYLHELEENDVLFIDNSHRVLPNSDAMVFFMEVLPRLKPGVVVQIHDIYLPYDYPQFMCDRFYNEQYALAAYVLANPEKYQTLMPNYFVSQDKVMQHRMKDFWAQMPASVEQHGGSYWITVGK